MSRRTQNAIVVVLLCLAALVVAALQFYSTTYKADTYDKYENSSRETCDNKLRVLEYKPSVQKREKADGQAEPTKYDEFCQQIRSAEAAEAQAIWARRQFWLGVLSFCFVVAATIAAGYAALQAQLAAKVGASGAKAAWRAAREAGKQAKAAQHTIEHSREAAMRQLRAYVTVKEISISAVGDGLKPTARLVLLNCGQSPALRLSAKLILKTGYRDTFERISFAGVGYDSIVTLAAGVDSQYEVDRSDPLPAGTFDLLKKGNAGICFAGVVRYFDVFGIRRFTVFKTRLRIETNGKVWMVACRKGNRNS